MSQQSKNVAYVVIGFLGGMATVCFIVGACMAIDEYIRSVC